MKKEDVLKLMASSKMEVRYNEDLDILDVDVNETLSKTHLGLEMLDALDPDIKRFAESKMKEGLNRRELIENILQKLRGIDYNEFAIAGYKTGMRAKLKPEWEYTFKRVKDTKIYAWSTSPTEVVKPFLVKNVINKYNLDVEITATDVETENGKLTGHAKRIIDSEMRERMQKERDRRLIS